MCTSIISNRKKTIVGWNLDILDMEYRVREAADGVYIEINDKAEGWLPLFGANSRGDFVGMPTCWPFDERSNPKEAEPNVIMLDIDLLTRKKTLREIKEIVESGPVCSVPGVTFMSSLSDKNGNVLHIIPGQGYKYYEKPKYQVLTNFSPFKMDKEQHPWMGLDRYHTAKEMLEQAPDHFDVKDCFAILQKVSQEVCPTVVSMVFDVTEMKVYWCENRQWDNIREKELVVEKMTAIQKKLFEIQDKDYAQFQAKLTPTVDPAHFIGVRVPACRAFAKNLYKNDIDGVKKFLSELPHKYYDENMLHGLLISEIKDFDLCICELEVFLPHVDNWAVCDIMSPKCVTKHKSELLPLIKAWTKSSEEYTVRFGLGMLMSHFLDGDFKPEYLTIAASVHSDKYYVNMMIAWFFATALAKQWDSTIGYIEDYKLEEWVHNKTIQKARESNRITDEQKLYLNKLKK